MLAQVGKNVGGVLEEDFVVSGAYGGVQSRINQCSSTLETYAGEDGLYGKARVGWRGGSSCP